MLRVAYANRLSSLFGFSYFGLLNTASRNNKSSVLRPLTPLTSDLSIHTALGSVSEKLVSPPFREASFVMKNVNMTVCVF